jgi:hypothetical protein
MNFKDKDATDNKAFKWIIISLVAFIFFLIYVLTKYPNKEFEIYIAIFAAIPTIILVGVTVMYVDASFKLVRETLLQRNRTFIEKIITKILFPLLDRAKTLIEWFDSNEIFHIKEQQCKFGPLNIKELVFSQHQEVFFKLFTRHYHGLSKKIESYLRKIPELEKDYSDITKEINTQEFRKKWEDIIGLYQKDVKGQDLFPYNDLSRAFDNILEASIKNKKLSNIPDRFWDAYKQEISSEHSKYRRDFERLDLTRTKIKKSLENIRKNIIDTINEEQEKYGILAMQ